MNTLDGKTINNTMAVAIRPEPHPLKANAKVFRAYEIEEDGTLSPLYIGRETPEAVKEEVKKFKSHKAIIFAEI